MRAVSFCSSLFRKKTFEAGNLLQSEFKRCLSVLDVTALALGQMIGSGIYVLTGQVTHSEAGPSIVLSFLLAGIAALLSAFSYAEFGARFPRAGSAYTYAYVGVGEVWAFVIGWTVLLEYMIGNAAVARTWSASLDALLHGAISNTTMDVFGITPTNSTLSEGNYFTRYPDFLAFFLILLVGVAVALGSQVSANVNKFFVVLNLLVMGFITVVCFTQADFSLWFGHDAAGVSRFFPFGVAGTMRGAGSVFFSFVGFDVLATAGEETKNPKRSIPIATFLSLGIVTAAYMTITASLTLMMPYDQVNVYAPFGEAFNAKNLHYAAIISTVGALFGMANNLVVGAFALPRTAYAMADDGLIFKCLATINKRTKVPLNAIIVLSIFNAILALIFDVDVLVEMLSIGTLIAYSFVSACVILLRHQCAPIDGDPDRMDNGGNLYGWVPFRNFWESLPQGMSVSIGVVLMVISQFCFGLMLQFKFFNSAAGIVALVVCAVFIGVFLLFIVGHQQNQLELSYKVPLVPFLPALSLLVNIFLMVSLEWLSFVRILIWTTIGLLIYFCYGYNHSKEGLKRRAIHDKSSRTK